MKKTITILLSVTVILLLFTRNCNYLPYEQKPDPRDKLIDSLSNVISTLETDYTTLEDSIRTISSDYNQALDSYRSNPIVKRIIQFRDRFGDPDTTAIVIIDTLIMDSCYTNTILLDSCREISYLKDRQINNLKDNVRVSKAVRLTLEDQLEDCRTDNKYCRQLLSLKWWQWIKRIRLKNKLK